MHPVGTILISAAFRSHNIDSRPLLKEDNETFMIGKSYVRGSECMPAASTIGSFIHQLKQEGKTDNASLFMPCTSGPCRFGQYARLHDMILQKENIDATIISPNSDSNYGEISGGLRLQLLKAIMVSDILFKLGCKLRPYEKVAGTTDKIINRYISIIEKVIEKKEKIKPYLISLNNELKKIELLDIKKPLIGVVGEIYVRNSPFSNANLVRNIENNGGEVWTTPVMEWLHYTGVIGRHKTIKDSIESFLSNKISHYLENKYMKIFDEFLHNRHEPEIHSVINDGKKYMPDEIEGEAILTIGRTIAFINQNAKLVVNVSPFGCMPGTIGTSILKSLSNEYKVPVVSVFYDGETDFTNILSTYLTNIVNKVS